MDQPVHPLLDASVDNLALSPILDMLNHSVNIQVNTPFKFFGKTIIWNMLFRYIEKNIDAGNAEICILYAQDNFICYGTIPVNLVRLLWLLKP